MAKKYKYPETDRKWRDANRPHLLGKRRLAKVGVRELILDLKSGGCVLCGYRKCAGALEFHHVSDDKEVSLSRVSSKGAALREAAKCIVVCANCHREIHAGQMAGYEHVERARPSPESYDDLPLLRLVETY